MLTGQTVHLRALGDGDVEAQWRWGNDPEVMRWMDDGYPETLAQFQERASRRSGNSYEEVRLGIETLEGERLIGVVVLTTHGPEGGAAELDIHIGEKDCWGRGYGTEATRLMCTYGFDKMRLHRIELWVAEPNGAAIRVYQRVGFVEEGRAREALRHEGRWHDVLLMSLLEDEFCS